MLGSDIIKEEEARRPSKEREYEGLPRTLKRMNRQLARKATGPSKASLKRGEG